MQSTHLAADRNDEVGKTGKEVRSVGVGGEDDLLGGDVPAIGLDVPCGGVASEARDGSQCLQVEVSSRQFGRGEEILEDTGDEFVGPHPRRHLGHYGTYGTWHSENSEFVFVPRDACQLGNVWSSRLQRVQCKFHGVEVREGVDGAHAGLRHEFAIDVFGVRETVQGVEVAELECGNAGVVWMLKEEWLAVAAVLRM